MTRSTLLAALCVLLFGHAANADEAALENAANALVKVFVSMCVRNVPDLDRIEHTASIMGLEDVTGLEGASRAPPGFKAWRVVGAADAPFTLSISRGHDKGRDVAVCAVTDPYAPSGPVEQALKAALGLGRPFRTESEGGQRYTYWDASINERKVIVSAVDASPMNAAGVNLAATVISHH